MEIQETIETRLERPRAAPTRLRTASYAAPGVILVLLGCGNSATTTSSAAPNGSIVLSAQSVPSVDASAARELLKQLGDVPLGKERDFGDGTFMTLHRTQATDPIEGGWQRAKSTEGGFSVELPLAFNDFRVRSESADHVEVRSHTVGAKTEGLLAWSATCIVRRDKKNGADPQVDEKKGNDEVVTVGTPIKAYQRTVVLPDRRCFMIVEAQGSDPLPPEKDRNRFFQSFKKVGDPTW